MTNSVDSSKILFLFLCFTATFCARSNYDRDCKVIGDHISKKGFSYPWWNSTEEQDSSNGCPISSTNPRSTKCCKTFTTNVLRSETRQAFSQKWLGPKLAVQAEVFSERKNRFDLTFKALLTRAHASFHAMFEKTYGMLYIQHAQVFHDLFTTFESYYDSGKHSLDTKLNEFFAILTRKMFEVLNSQYEFDDAYLHCAAIVISDKQGNDLHRQIVSSLRRSFVATRALAQGLYDGNRVLTSLQKLDVSPDCLLSLSQMLHCPVCLEQRPYKPCIQLCTKVSMGCLSGTTLMTRPWTEFTTALEGIIDRLLGPYNVEAVVEPIHIKISEAIMNFQESGPDLSQAVFAKCGKPNLRPRGVSKREADPLPPKTSEVRVKPGRNGGGRERAREREREQDNDNSSGGDGDIQPSKSLEKLLKETKKKIQKTKTIWEKLPQQVCNGISKDYSSKLCWNGSALITPDGRSNKSGEENEVKSNSGGGRGLPSQLIGDQILVLQLITDKLRASYNGQDVQWVPEIAEEIDLESGSGSGSGEIPDDDDDETGDNDPETGLPVEKTPRPSTRRPSVPSDPPSIIPFNPRPIKPGNDDRRGEYDKEADNSVTFRNRGPDSSYIPNENSNNYNVNFQTPTKPSRTSNNNSGSNNKGNIATQAAPPLPTSTRTPPQWNNNDVIKSPPTSSGTMDATTKTVAVFKLFTPIFVSMLGKLVSLS